MKEEGKMEGKMFKYTSFYVDGVVTIIAEGQITLGESCFCLRRLLKNLLDNGNKNIIICLYGVTRIDSSGINMLTESLEYFRARGGFIWLTEPSTEINQLFKLLDFYDNFEIPDTLKQAMRNARR